MRDRRKRLAKASKKGAITPKNVIVEQERMRLARRLSTLDFPLAACVDALREKDNNIRAAVDLLLEWHPKGSGGRAAVEKLLQVLLGAENKLQNMRNKLQVLYAPKVGSSGAAGPLSISAVREIFDRYDVDMSGSIDMDEFRKMMRDLGVRMTPEEFREAVGVSLTFHFFFVYTVFFIVFTVLTTSMSIMSQLLHRRCWTPMLTVSLTLMNSANGGRYSLAATKALSSKMDCMLS